LSHDRYVDFYDFAPVGYVTLSGKGLIQDINLTATPLLGEERIRLWQMHFSALVATEDCDSWHRSLTSLMREPDKTR